MIRYDRNIEREEGRKAAQHDAYSRVLDDYKETAKKRALDIEEYGDLTEARDFFKKEDPKLYKKAVRIIKDADEKIKQTPRKPLPMIERLMMFGESALTEAERNKYGLRNNSSTTAAKGNSNT